MYRYRLVILGLDIKKDGIRPLLSSLRRNPHHHRNLLIFSTTDHHDTIANNFDPFQAGDGKRIALRLLSGIHDL